MADHTMTTKLEAAQPKQEPVVTPEMIEAASRAIAKLDEADTIVYDEMAEAALSAALNAASSPSDDVEQLRAENARLKNWRDLAVQFDMHRMNAMGILRAAAEGHDVREMSAEFLQQPPPNAQTALTASEAENKRLRMLVRDAYFEGHHNSGRWSVGMDERHWQASKARTALEQVKP